MSVDLYESRLDALFDFINGKTSKLQGKFLDELSDLLSVKVVFDSQTHYIDTTIGNVFEIQKGSTSFTEEVIYQNFKDDGVPVYGGGAKVSSYKVDLNTKNKKGQKVKIFQAPAIVVSMDGSSGSMTVVRDGKFTANHHAAVLLPHSETIDLDWVVQTVSLGLKKEASNKEGSATLTMERLENFRLEVPIPSQQTSRIGGSRRKLQSLANRFS
ncbi:MAG TPA: hypothetical protein DCM40_43565 [Maribacter sp.]|nr:hypothetical protein [Maribacter sp.]